MSQRVASGVLVFQFEHAQGFPIADVSPSVSELLGYAPEEMIGNTLRELVEPSFVVRLDIEERAGRPLDGMEIPLMTSEAEIVWVALDASLEEMLGRLSQPASRDGEERAALLIRQGVDRTRERALVHELATAREVLEQSSQAIAVHDRNGVVEWVNARYLEVTGFEESEVLGHSVPVISDDRRDLSRRREALEAISKGHAWRGELKFLRKKAVSDKVDKETENVDRTDGTDDTKATDRQNSPGNAASRESDDAVRWGVISFDPIVDAKGRVSRYVSMVEDITELKEAQTKLEQMAFNDPLTELPNRRRFLERLQLAVESSQRGQSLGALMYLDLDQFKQINDTLGHSAGDTVLETIAERLRKRLRSTDIVSRIGGDEFTILLMDVKNRSTCARIAEEILSEVAKPIALDGEHKIKRDVTASIGITIIPEDSLEADRLLDCADQALYEAKGAGKNRYRFFERHLVAGESS